MYLNNDVQQWWYFLISGLFILSTIGPSLLAIRSWSYLNGDEWWQCLRLCYYLRFVLAAFFAIKVYWLPAFWFWYSKNNDSQRCWYLRAVFAVFAVVFITGSFLLGLWTRYWMTDDIWQPCWNVRPTATMPFTIWPFFYPFCGLYSTNDGYQQEQLWRYLKLMLVVLCHLYVIEMVLLASWYWFHVNDKDQQLLYWSESVVAILLALGSFL